MKRDTEKKREHGFARIGMVCLGLVAVLFATPSDANAQSSQYIIGATDDAYVKSSSPHKNYGLEKELEADPGKERIIFTKFDLTRFANVAITKAEFKMFITDDTDSNVYVKRVDDNTWSENTITFNNMPERSPAIAVFNAKKEKSWKSIDITNYVNANKGKFMSFGIESPAWGDDLKFYSKENSKNHPQLVITVGNGVVLSPVVSKSPVISKTTAPTKKPVAPSTVPPTKVVTKVPVSVAPTNKPVVTATKSPNPTATKVPLPTATKAPTAVPTKVVTAAPQPTSAGGGTTAAYPGQIINLNNWKLTLPTGGSKDPTEIKQPSLATYKNDPYFLVSGDNGVRFRAPVTGVTTSGSSYPRSELREMVNNGKDKASWSSTSGKHTMYLEQAVTHLPKAKPHIVVGQVHDSSDDVIVIRLEGKKLQIDVDGADGPVLDSNYTLGKKFAVKFEVQGGQTKIYYNNSNTPAYTLSRSYSGAYFKAGAYTQSNCSRETDCSANNYGEAIIYKAVVTHE